MPTIYLISANPFTAPLKIDVEHRAILRRLPASWDIKPGPAARISDIISDLRRYQPDIVHFSAHGSPMERLVLLDDDGKPQEVSRATIDDLFDVMRGNIRLVVLNACYSRQQAELIAASIDCVIGIDGTLQDTNAISYSEQFYEALAAGRSVQQAHQEAGIILTDVPTAHKPDLIVKSDVDADRVFIARISHPRRQERSRPRASSGPASSHAAGKMTAYREAVARSGVSAERVTILKIANPDGSYISQYEVENLQPVRTEITSMFWRFVSTSGLVTAPILEDSASEAGISWITEPDPAPSSFEDVLKNLGTLRGKFVFDPPLKPAAPRSFAWKIQVLNGDALTAWEFHNLYSRKQQVHLNGKPLTGKPSEFFAQLVWFPIRELRMELRLPPSQTSRPQLKFFDLKNSGSEGVPPDQIVQNGELWAYPNSDTDWARKNAAWERNSDMQRREMDSLRSAAGTELTIEYPPLGSFYSLDWTLPDPPLPPDIDRLRGEAEVIREAFLTLRSVRSSGPANQDSEQVTALFEEVHRKASDFLNAKEPSFTTALMTWDRKQRRMVVVEVCRNDGGVKEADWNFWLPFGLGLAGMCFRTATDAFRYQHDLDRADPERPENYLPVPGADPHAFLLSLPIDHPEMTEEMGSQPHAQRCRQLIGVLSIGSASPASHLLEYCRLTISDAVFERLRDLRDACQEKLDAISKVLLERAGISTPVRTLAPTRSPEEGHADATEAESVRDDSGIIHQPGPGWVSPIRTNRFQFKVAAFDFDGTLLRGEKFAFSWELVWRCLGFGKAIQNELKRDYRQQAQQATNRAARVEAYRRWCERAVERFSSRGLTRDQIRAMSQPLSLTKNCREALTALRTEGVVTAIISGGISAVLEDTFFDYRNYFDFAFMNELLFSDSGVISGVRATAYDFEGKTDALALVCGRAGATREETVFIGDHFNDEAIMLQVKRAIAYPASDAVIESVSHLPINEDNLLKVVPHVLVE